jgi:hypothetical protein
MWRLDLGIIFQNNFLGNNFQSLWAKCRWQDIRIILVKRNNTMWIDIGIILVKRNTAMWIDIRIILIYSLSKCVKLFVKTYHQTVQILEFWGKKAGDQCIFTALLI